jgi:hypothetical protein
MTEAHRALAAARAKQPLVRQHGSVEVMRRNEELVPLPEDSPT